MYIYINNIHTFPLLSSERSVFFFPLTFGNPILRYPNSVRSFDIHEVLQLQENDATTVSFSLKKTNGGIGWGEGMMGSPGRVHGYVVHLPMVIVKSPKDRVAGPLPNGLNGL